MKPPAILAAYAAGLAAVLAAGVGIGAVAGPLDVTTSAHGGTPSRAPSAAPAPDAVPAGLAVASDGYALALDPAPLRAGRPAVLSFRVLDARGAAVTDYEVEHEKELHLVLVRRDGTGYQHLHPTRAADGRWSTPVVLPAGGSYKAFADFVPAGRSRGVVLAADLQVDGGFRADPLPAEQRRAVVGGYQVEVHGRLEPGRTSRLVLRVIAGGGPVTDLQPYLGAFGHLVALRDGDLAYLHVHPDGGHAEGLGGPEVAFSVEVPTAGTYRVFFDFQHQGVVRSAALSLPAGGSVVAPAPAPTAIPSDDHADDGHGH